MWQGGDFPLELLDPIRWREGKWGKEKRKRKIKEKREEEKDE